MKRILAFLISMSIILTCFAGLSLSVYAADLSSIGIEGTGTEADPFIIDTAEKFIAVFGAGASSTTQSITHGDAGDNLYFLQTADIDLSGANDSTLFYAPSTSYVFKGTYRGGDKNGDTITYSVKNIDVKIDTTSSYSGVFPYIESAEISNISLTGSVNLKANTKGPYIGGIVGRAEKNSLIKNCHNYASVSESITYATVSEITAYMGGVIGLSVKSDVIGCSNQGTVTSNTIKATVYAAGVVGYAQFKEDVSGSVQSCWNAGTVTAKRTGGIAGRIHMWSTYPGLTSKVVKNLYNTGTLNHTDTSYYGGLAAYASGDSSVKEQTRHEFSGFYDTTGVNKVIGGWGSVEKVNQIVTNAYSYSADEDATFTNSERVSKNELISIAGSDDVFADDSVWEAGNSLNPFPGLVGNPYTAAALNIPDEPVETTVYTELSGSSYTLKWTAYPAASGYNVYVADERIAENVTALSYDITAALTTGNEKIEVKALVSGEETDMETAYAFAGGTGKEANPYLVSNIIHLNNVRNKPDAHFVQTADIPEALTAPIGTLEAPFSGSYKGADNSNKIVHLNMNDASLPIAGMFAVISGADISYITTTGTVSNGNQEITVDDNGTSKLVNAIGGIVGYSMYAGGANATITSCINKANVSKTADADKTGRMVGVAGIIGYAPYATVTYCENHGTIDGNGTSSVGGISGYHGKPISYCKNYGTINGGSGSATGGIAGSQYGNISYCANLAPVTATNNNLGGIVGSICASASVTYCYNAGEVIGTARVGGIAGRIYATASATTNVNNCFNAGEVTGTSLTAAIVGYSERGKVINISNCYDSYNDGMQIFHSINTATASTTTLNINNSYVIGAADNQAIAQGGKTITSDSLKALLTSDTTFASAQWQVGKNDLYEYPELKKIPYEEPIVIEKPFKKGDGTKASPYQVSSKEEFMRISDFKDAYFIQTADIEDITESVFTSSNAVFGGEYDGNNFSIDVDIKSTDDESCGLFGYVKGTIKNLTVTGKVTSSATYTGGIVGNTSTGFKIINCKNYADITSTAEQTGGIGGRTFSSGSILNCYNYGTIKAKRCGGITGVINSGTVVDGCGNYGYVEAQQYAAGIAYWSYGSISNSFNAGNITATNSGSSAAGIVNLLQTSYTTKKNASTGKYEVVYDANGKPSAAYMSVIENCYNIGTLNAGVTAGIALRQDGKVGSYSVTNCYNTVYATYPVCDLTDKEIAAYVEECNNTDENTFNTSGNFYLSAVSFADELAGTACVASLDDLKAIAIDAAVYSISGDYEYPQLTANKLDEAKDDISFVSVTVDKSALANASAYVKNFPASSFFVQKGYNKLLVVAKPTTFYSVEVLKNDVSLGEFIEEDSFLLEADDNTSLAFVEEKIAVDAPENVETATAVFTSNSDTITVDGADYTRYAIVAAKAAKATGLKLKSFGVLITKNEGEFDLTTDNVVAAAANTDKISSSGAYGVLIYGDSAKGIKDNMTYYTRPYVIYEDVDGTEYTSYGAIQSFVITTTPVAE